MACSSCHSLPTRNGREASPVGYLGDLPGPFAEAFRQGLRDIGYLEGQNLIIEYRWAEGKGERLPTLAAELVELPVDVLVTAGSLAARAAQHATSTIPIVFAHVGDPVGYGLVASLARPGGNLTGISVMGIELGGKQLELLKEAVPGVARVAVLRNPANPGAAQGLRVLEGAARALEITLHPVEVRGADEFERAFATLLRCHARRACSGAGPPLFFHTDPGSSTWWPSTDCQQCTCIGNGRMLEGSWHTARACVRCIAG